MEEGIGGDDLDPGSPLEVAPTIDTDALIKQLLEDRAAQQKIISGLRKTIDSLQTTVERLLDEMSHQRLPAASKTVTTTVPPTLTCPQPPPITAPKAKRPRTIPPANLQIPAPKQPIKPPTSTASKPPPLPPPILTVTPATFTTTPPTAKPNDTVPPIILHDKDCWILVSSVLNSLKLQYTRATNTREGIRITPASITDYRSITAHLKKENLSFHSFQLPSEKNIKVVFRGVPQSRTIDQIILDLNNQSYITIHVTRLNGRNNRPAPLVLVQVERKYKSIFNLTTLCGLDVTVEAKRIPSGPLQCHRCQRFGHTQPNCHAPYRCMKCAETHSTHTCPKPSTTPAVCANCKSSHISSHHSCPQNPTNLKKTYASTLKSSSPTQPLTTQLPTSHPNITTPSHNSFASLAFPLFEALLATNPSVERVTAFTNQITLPHLVPLPSTSRYRSETTPPLASGTATADTQTPDARHPSRAQRMGLPTSAEEGLATPRRRRHNAKRPITGDRLSAM